MKALVAALLAAVTFATAAAAQSPSDPVAVAYAEYRAAIESGDASGAERAAAAALVASEARDGDGGATAVLAYNLALVRLDAGNPGAAHAPASRAHAIAEAGGGLNPLLARLALGEAELGVAPESGRDRLLAALQETSREPALSERAYAAGAALGTWALNAGDFQVAQTAWSAAAAHAEGDAPMAVLRRGRANTGQAVAMIAEHAHLPGHRARDRAYAILNAVVDELYPHALVEVEGQALTAFQIAYAEALAWRDYGRADYTPRPESVRRNLDGAVMCDVRWSGAQTLAHTLALSHRGSHGVAVFRALVDEDGAVTRLDVASQAPAQDLSQSVAPHLERLRVARSSRSERGCQMPRVVFFTVVLARRL